MARVKEIKIGVTDSVKLGEYQYVKPTLEFTLQLDKGDMLEDFVEQARERMLSEMEKLKKDLVSQIQKKGFKRL